MIPDETQNIILVTGSTGLIGSKVMESLSHKYKMVGLDVKEPKIPAENSDFIACDMTKDKSVTDALTRRLAVDGW